MGNIAAIHNFRPFRTIIKHSIKSISGPFYTWNALMMAPNPKHRCRQIYNLICSIVYIHKEQTSNTSLCGLTRCFSSYHQRNEFKSWWGKSAWISSLWGKDDCRPQQPLRSSSSSMRWLTSFLGLHMWASQPIVNRTLNEHANHRQALSGWHWCMVWATTPALIAFVHQLIRYAVNGLLKCLQCGETHRPLFKQRVCDLPMKLCVSH